MRAFHLNDQYRDGIPGIPTGVTVVPTALMMGASIISGVVGTIPAVMMSDTERAASAISLESRAS